MSHSPCALCGNPGTEPYHADRWRSCRRCGRCGFVHVPPAFHLAREAEGAGYDHHHNAVDDPGYRCFLGRLATPLTDRERFAGWHYIRDPTHIGFFSRFFSRATFA